ncbi:hypothetical protein Plhal304r1_c015g0055871 [Plasmopara halstedii]
MMEISVGQQQSSFCQTVCKAHNRGYERYDREQPHEMRSETLHDYH